MFAERNGDQDEYVKNLIEHLIDTYVVLGKSLFYLITFILVIVVTVNFFNKQ